MKSANAAGVVDADSTLASVLSASTAPRAAPFWSSGTSEVSSTSIVGRHTKPTAAMQIPAMKKAGVGARQIAAMPSATTGNPNAMEPRTPKCGMRSCGAAASRMPTMIRMGAACRCPHPNCAWAKRRKPSSSDDCAMIART
eukprot:scaffold13049_cov122-Isochrysis_galbana.AAC.1